MLRKLTYHELLNNRKTIEESQLTNKFPLSVILNNVRSMYNVGSIFRTCDAAAVSELILTGYTPYPPRKEIDKTALDATKTVHWSYHKDIMKAINIQKDKGKKIIAVELTNNSKNCFNIAKNDFPLALIFGNELTGIDNDVLEFCDDAIEIPMFGVKHSLNVSVSAGIAIYECIRIISDKLITNISTKL